MANNCFHVQIQVKNQPHENSMNTFYFYIYVSFVFHTSVFRYLNFPNFISSFVLYLHWISWVENSHFFYRKYFRFAMILYVILCVLCNSTNNVYSCVTIFPFVHIIFAYFHQFFISRILYVRVCEYWRASFTSHSLLLNLRQLSCHHFWCWISVKMYSSYNMTFD